MSDDITITNIEEIPDSWSDDDVERIERRLESIAEGIERLLALGKSKEEIVAGWRAHATQQGIQSVDLRVEGGEFTISVSEDCR